MSEWPSSSCTARRSAAVGEQMTGERMAQHVRRNRRHPDACPRCEALEVAGKDLPRQMAGLAVGGEQPGAVRTVFLQLFAIGAHGADRRLRER